MIYIAMNNILQTSILGSVGIILIVILRKPILKKYTQNFVYYIWLPIVIKLIIPFKITLNLPKKLYSPIGSSSFKIKTANVVYSMPVTYKTNASTIPTYNISEIAAYLWLTGIMIFTIYYIYSYFKFTKKINKFSYTITDSNIKNIYSKLICELKIKNKISLKYCSNINTPFGMGLFNSKILIPKINYTDDQLTWILKHELMHFKKYDLLYKLLLIMTLIIHWFNPLVYVMCKIINSDCELACDEAILKNSNLKNRKLYANTLVNSIRLSKNFTIKNSIMTGFNSDKNILKRRIENMFNIKIKNKGILIGTLAALIVGSSFIGFKSFAAEDNSALSKPQKTTISKTNSTNIKSRVSTYCYSNKSDYENDITNIDNELKEYPNSIKIHFVSVATSTVEMVQPEKPFTRYTYSTAPKAVREIHEFYCKMTNQTPEPSNIICIQILN